MTKKIAYGWIIVAIITCVWSIIQTRKCNNMMAILNQKDKLISDGYDEMIMQNLQAIKDQNIELARTQGRLEGIIAIVHQLPPDSNDASSIWHAGYARGLEQKEYTDKMYPKGNPFNDQSSK
jgi:hypothetical protein